MKVKLEKLVRVKIDEASNEFMERLYNFQKQEKVFPRTIPYSWIGGRAAYYSESDAERLREWMAGQAGVVMTVQTEVVNLAGEATTAQKEPVVLIDRPVRLNRKKTKATLRVIEDVLDEHLRLRRVRRHDKAATLLLEEACTELQALGRDLGDKIADFLDGHLRPRDVIKGK